MNAEIYDETRNQDSMTRSNIRFQIKKKNNIS